MKQKSTTFLTAKKKIEEPQQPLLADLVLGFAVFFIPFPPLQSLILSCCTLCNPTHIFGGVGLNIHLKSVNCVCTQMVEQGMIFFTLLYYVLQIFVNEQVLFLVWKNIHTSKIMPLSTLLLFQLTSVHQPSTHTLWQIFSLLLSFLTLAVLLPAFLANSVAPFQSLSFVVSLTFLLVTMIPSHF